MDDDFLSDIETIYTTKECSCTHLRTSKQTINYISINQEHKYAMLYQIVIIIIITITITIIIIVVSQLLPQMALKYFQYLHFNLSSNHNVVQ
jgi:hypothetical protein